MVFDLVTPKQRPYLKKPDEFSYWKKSSVWTGRGKEFYNYASPFTRRFWYYVRSMGHIQHAPGWMCEHHGQDGFVLHVVESGEVWHDIKGRRHTVGRGQACLVDLRQDVTYGVGGARKSEIYWAWINGKDLPTVFLELGADQDPVFPLADPPRTKGL